MAKEKKDKEKKEKGEGGGGAKKIIIMVLPAVVVGAGMFFFLGGKSDASAGTTTTTIVQEGDVIDVDTLTVNIVGEEGRYARVGFALVLSSTASGEEIAKKLPLVRDAAIDVLTAYSAADLQSQDGQERLRQELSDRCADLYDGDVLRVVLTELIVQ
jgi:flagellar FliL protein